MRSKGIGGGDRMSVAVGRAPSSPRRLLDGRRHLEKLQLIDEALSPAMAESLREGSVDNLRRCLPELLELFELPHVAELLQREPGRFPAISYAAGTIDRAGVAAAYEAKVAAIDERDRAKRDRARRR